MNPNYDEMANPDKTYVDIGYGHGLEWRLPEQQKADTQKKKKANSRSSKPTSDTMRDILLQLNSIPGYNTQLSDNEGNQRGPANDDFVERPLGPYHMLTPSLPTRKFRVSGIPESELAAAQRGQRWHWHNENSFMPPGSQWNETVWKGADRENAWLSQMIKERGQDLKQITSPIGTARERANMQSMWKQFLSDVKNGHFDSYGGTSDSAKQWATKFKERYNSIFGEGAIAELAPEPEVLGKRAELQRKKFQDLESNINDTEFYASQLKKWYERGNFEDPAQVKLITDILDKVGQSFTAAVGGDSKNMADAEKIRIQIIHLPQASRDEVYKTIENYRDAMISYIKAAGADAWLNNNWTKLNEVIDSPDSAHSLLRTLGSAADILSGKIGGDVPALPIDLAGAAQNCTKLLDDYMQQMVLAANVAPSVVSAMAEYLHDQSVNNYNQSAKTAGRNSTYKLGLPDLQGLDLDRFIPVDPLIKAIDFPHANLAKPPKGKMSGNPQTDKEGKGKPSPAGTGNTGIGAD